MKQQSEEINKVVIIGGVAGGATAAARLRRLNEKAQIMVFDKGPYVSFANCGLPYHLSEAIPSRDSLILKTPDDFSENYNIDVKVHHEVIHIDREKKRIEVKDLKNGKVYFEDYQKLILSPGATAFTPNFDNPDQIKIHLLKTIPDMDEVISSMKKDHVKKVLVLGGGFIGVEIAENLTEKGVETHLVELSSQIMTPFDYEMANRLHKEMIDNGVYLHLQKAILKIKKRDQGDQENGAIEATLTDGQILHVDMIISAVGIRPESDLAKRAGIEVSERGAIITNHHMQTSDPDIYAVGDVVQVKHMLDQSLTSLALASPANRQARVASDHLMGVNSVYQGVQGTSIIKIFNLAAGSTGFNEKTAKQKKLDYDVFYLHPNNHVTYYPGASSLTMKIIYEKKSFKLLGAQIIGAQAVDKKIDVLATAMRGGMTLFELQDIEFAYAPPFGSAKDAINMVGFMASNIERGLVQFLSPAHLTNLNGGEYQIVDVRTPEEFELGHIPSAINIPLYQLRSRYQELNSNKKTVVYCAVGVRSFNGYRALKQLGFKELYNLTGGYKIYQSFYENYANRPTAIRTHHLCKEITEVEVHSSTNTKVELNLIGLQCPGPIVALKRKLDELNYGDEVTAYVSDKGFVKDVASFCDSLGYSFLGVVQEGANFKARIRKEKKDSPTSDVGHNRGAKENFNKKTMVVFSNDYDRAMAVFIIANGAKAMGSEVVLFFTFWGLSLLKKEAKRLKISEKKTVIEKMFSMMMPKGSRGVKLSKMNMMGMGSLMMKKTMKKKNVNSLRELIEMAQRNGVKLVACSMTMDVMGIKEEELIEGVEIGGVANYLGEAEKSNMNLFI